MFHLTTFILCISLSSSTIHRLVLFVYFHFLLSFPFLCFLVHFLSTCFHLLFSFLTSESIFITLPPHSEPSFLIAFCCLFPHSTFCFSSFFSSILFNSPHIVVYFCPIFCFAVRFLDLISSSKQSLLYFFSSFIHFFMGLTYGACTCRNINQPKLSFEVLLFTFSECLCVS